MLDKRHLVSGLNALSRAHELNYFEDGHRGAAIIASVYLCQENAVEAGVSEEIAAIIDERWADTELCAPFPDEGADPQLLGQIADCLAANLEGLRQVGHNVIFPALALKAFREVPEAVTRSRVTGICRLIESFTVTEISMSDPVDLPSLGDQISFAEFVLDEFVACTDRFLERGQGWSGHLLTYGQALTDLRDLGYLDLAHQARDGFRIYIRRIRMGPQGTDKPRDEHAPTDLWPLQLAYWKERGGDLYLGHKLKYPYGFYGLMSRARDPEIKRRCSEIAYRLL